MDQEKIEAAIESAYAMIKSAAAASKISDRPPM
jgi:hypothetical protein